MTAADDDLVRRAFAKVATNVAIVTTSGPDGPHGVTANGWGELPGEPVLLVTLTEESNSLARVLAAGRFAVNLLRGTQEPLARRFARPESRPGERFEGLSRHELADNVVLDDCLAAFSCRVVETFPFGARRIVVGSVERAEIGDGEPLVFFDRGFTRCERTDRDRTGSVDAR
jgi:flavin reductase ActVB